MRGLRRSPDAHYTAVPINAHPWSLLPGRAWEVHRDATSGPVRLDRILPDGLVVPALVVADAESGATDGGRAGHRGRERNAEKAKTLDRIMAHFNIDAGETA